MLDKHERLAMQHLVDKLEAAKKELNAWRKNHQDQEFNPKTNKLEWKIETGKEN